MPAVHSSVKPFTANQEYVGIDKIRIIYPLDTELSDGSSDLFTKNGVRTTIKGTQLAYAKGSIPTENGGTIYFELRNNGNLLYRFDSEEVVMSMLKVHTNRVLVGISSGSGTVAKKGN